MGGQGRMSEQTGPPPCGGREGRLQTQTRLTVSFIFSFSPAPRQTSEAAHYHQMPFQVLRSRKKNLSRLPTWHTRNVTHPDLLRKESVAVAALSGPRWASSLLPRPHTYVCTHTLEHVHPCLTD